MRSAATSVLLVLLLAACGGGDLTLPGPGDPATLTIVAGDGQQAQPGELVPDPLIVALQDGVGQPIAGRVVAFRFLDDFAGAAIDPGEASTDEQGRVTIPTPWAGRYVLEVTHFHEKPGGSGEEKFNRTRHISSLSFVQQSGIRWTDKR